MAKSMQRIDERSLVAAAKPGLVVLDTPELNVETPAHLLDDDITLVSRLFVRNTGAMPAMGAAEIAAWTLTVEGFGNNAGTGKTAALRRECEGERVPGVREGAGSGGAFFGEPVGPVQWRHGAVGCVRWTGWRLGDLLRRCEPMPRAVYTGHYS